MTLRANSEIITLTQQTQSSTPAACGNEISLAALERATGGASHGPAAAGDTFTVSRSTLAALVEAELKAYFFDGVQSTLGQYAIDRIVGGIVGRVEDHATAAN